MLNKHIFINNIPTVQRQLGLCTRQKGKTMKQSEFEKIMELFAENGNMTLKQRQAVSQLIEADNELFINNLIGAVEFLGKP